MTIRSRKSVVWVALLTGMFASACRTTWVIVPRPAGGYRALDTLRATSNGKDVRVTFRFDTITHTQTLYVRDTLWREGTRIIHDTLRLVRRDTVRLVRHDTVRVGIQSMRVDTVRIATGTGRVDTVRVTRRDTVVQTRTVVRADTVYLDRQSAMQIRVDTVRLIARDTVIVPRTIVRVDTVRRVDTVATVRTARVGQLVDTVRVVRTDTVRVTRTDTVRIVRRDTIRLVRTDTVRIGRADTVRLARRTIFVPPGQYPPAGQCRVWIYDKPPGQQRNAAPCDALGDVPGGAFILFGGEAYDFDYDWISEERSGRVPPQVVAAQKKAKGRKP